MHRYRKICNDFEPGSDRPIETDFSRKTARLLPIEPDISGSDQTDPVTNESGWSRLNRGNKPGLRSFSVFFL